MINENESSATFSFALGTFELQFILGHVLKQLSSSTGIKHWDIRKAVLNIKRNPEAEPCVKLADYLFGKEWTPENLSNLFKTTKNLQKGLNKFGTEVNKYMQFILNMHEIEGNHCRFDVDANEMKVRVEFFSIVKIYSFAIDISYGQGFKNAKYEGTHLNPLVSNGFMISSNIFTKIKATAPQGWRYLKELVETLDQYVAQSELN